jgi:putative component of membrane protein insertase Oxa1/YidC/SpoIIIJ protein YidD
MNALQQLVKWCFRGLGKILIGCVRLYQILLSPLLGKNCRFHPSCSSFFIIAVEK